MATKTLLTVKEYAALEEPEGVRYELSEGELIVIPSASLVSQWASRRLQHSFANVRQEPQVGSRDEWNRHEDDRRSWDVAFISAKQLKGIDLDQSPLPVSPDLVAEIVSTNDRADDLFLKASQYIQAGARAVWLLYPRTLLAYRYLPGNLEPEVRSAEAGDKFEEPELLPGFSLALAEVLG
jgi:Uma2 family endonuclease